MSVSLRLTQQVSLGQEVFLLGGPVTFVSLMGCPRCKSAQAWNPTPLGWIQFPPSMDSDDIGEGTGWGTGQIYTGQVCVRCVLSWWSSVRWRWIHEVGEGSQTKQRYSGQRHVTRDGVMALRDDFWRGLLEDGGSRKMMAWQRERGSEGVGAV